MLVALILMAQVAGVEVATAGTVATCRVPDDPHQRTWSLARRDGAWLVVFRSRALDQPSVELRLPGVDPVIAAGETRVAFTSANGGRSVEWRIAKGESTLDLYVNHGLEVNVEADLDPAVDLMNTEGAINVTCSLSGSGIREPGAEWMSEWIVSIGAARSVDLFQSTAGRSYGVQTIGWARTLTGDLRVGPVRGRFAWGVEAMPLFAQFSPVPIYGIGFAPVVWRWDFPPQPRYSVFAELSMGGMWTSDPIPEETSRGNFTAHWGGGVRLRPRGGRALVLAYRFQHFSNGNQLGSNPGVNSHVVLIGWSRRGVRL
jgi:hypothetical protein